MTVRKKTTAKKTTTRRRKKAPVKKHRIGEFEQLTSSDEIEFESRAGLIYEVLQKIEGPKSAKRGGLKDTPERVVRSWRELYAGYDVKDPAEILRVFDDSENYDSMVVLRNVEFHSMCEHHMLPFAGSAHVAYIPVKGRVVGVSKLARLLDVYARRLQMQERIGQQVVTALMKDPLRAKGAACIIDAAHLCIACRGVRKQHSRMTTASLRGVFRDEPAARAELYSLIGMHSGNGN